MIAVRGLSKRYGRQSPESAVEGVTFTVEKGETIGILGGDRSGKTTILRTLATLLRPSSGSLTVGGLDPVTDGRSVREVLGYLPQSTYVQTDLSVAAYLDFWARVDGLGRKERADRLSALTEFLDLSNDLKEKMRTAPTFVQRRAALGIALLQNPVALVLDEPLAGLSASERERFHQKLRALAEKGTAIVITAARLRDVRPVAGKLVILYEGRATQAYPTPELLRLVGEARHARVFIEADVSFDRIPTAISGVPGILDARPAEGVVLLFVDPSRFSVDALRHALASSGIEPRLVREADLSINDIFRTVSRREAS